MAYNPFNIFRRNQKAIFAVLTVFIMIMFTLSSGVVGGDFFEWLPRWLGAKGKRGDAVCTIDGDKIYEGELTDPRTGLRYKRVMANRFMSMAAGYTVETLGQYAEEQRNKLSPEAQRLMGQIAQRQNLLQFAMQNPNPAEVQQLAAMMGIDLANAPQEIRGTLAQMVNSPTLKPDDKEVARAMLAAMTIQQSRGGPEQYFGNSPNGSTQDLVNFLLWQKKADQLGIKFTADDVRELVKREFYGYFSPQADAAVKQAMGKSMPGFNMDECLRAIGEEFRVRTAQTAVLGDLAHGGRWDKTAGGFPAFSTPFDMFEFFREETSPTTYAAIPVSAANFVDRVPPPDENDPKVRDELKKLYQQYKDDEPNPGKETPGFKEPRKVGVEWLSVTGTEPYYAKLAEERLKVGEPLAKLGSLLTAPVGGVGAGAVAAAVAPIAVPQALLEEEYKRKVADMHRSEVDLRWSRSSPGFTFSPEPFGMVLDTSIVRPGNMAVAAGAVGGQLLAFGNPFAAAAAAGTGPIAYEIRDRAKAGVPFVLGGVPALVGFETLVAGEAAYRLMVPKPVPIDVYRDSLLKDLAAQNARRIATEDLRAFVDEVKKLSDNGRPKDPAAVQKFIAEWAAKRGLKVAGTEAPRTEFTLEEDPALAPLVAAQRESLRSAAPFHGGRQRGYVPFGDRFFWKVGPAGGRGPSTGTYLPEFYPTEVQLSEGQLEKQPQYVVWRKTEEAAKPRLETAAWEDVKLAWRRMKARELAKAEAEKLAGEIRAVGASSEATLTPRLGDIAAALKAQFPDPKAKKRVDPFLIRGVAPLTTVSDPTGGQERLTDAAQPTPPGPLSQFRVRPSENLRYPPNEIGKTLLDDRTKPVNTTMVLPDAAKDTFYVITLVKRELKTDTDYKLEVTSPFARQAGGAVVQRAFTFHAQDETIKSVLGLLKQEFKFEATDEQKQKLEKQEMLGGDV